MSETKHYVDQSGVYVGGYSGAEPPEGSVEVPYAPDDARQVWDGSQWSEVPEQVPASVTKRQAKLALLKAGLLDDVEAHIAGMERGDQIEWDDSVSFSRSSPLIEKVGGALSLSKKKIDDLFRSAEKL